MRKGDTKQKNEPKNSAPKTVRIPTGPSAKQRRHERNIARARELRCHQGKRGGQQRQIMIDQKAATRRRMSSYTPKVRSEHSSAGREHRKPRH